MPNPIHSDTTTEGIRVQVFPDYLPQHSNPEENQYVFSYRVIISNEGDQWAKLISRHWVIINAEGRREEVKGPGVVGVQPELAPNDQFEYTSFCPIDTYWGTMEGAYQMERENGDAFDAIIGRFYLAAPQEALVEHEAVR